MSNYFRGFWLAKVSLWNDIKTLGWRETLRKAYVLREVWWEKGDKQLVGKDKFGNTYWQTTLPTELNRGRWVELARKDRIYDASDIPAEWHMWIHRLREEPPTEAETNRKGFGVRPTHTPNYTGEPEKRHYPPGHFFNPEHKDVSTLAYAPEKVPKQHFEELVNQKKSTPSTDATTTSQ
ncbi:predicted protein [Naegleria gruberi]|uniref:NADH dehydrogenase [ubiquinone] 1 alpha subcomplex subunit 12 n=1 Tax=Naegleria gruberi TaxID=5762 RepID=D2V7S7_NAEGR|nr:uncharacterized protein NAEGRDRAFT_78931 [Naegleria gruberi]EFC47053.1 predicted protein [Naegleria gruberi]|eukprot:XP_002679797.1 predicted protein [Naegleria gruberi strain NEG-M]